MSTKKLDFDPRKDSIKLLYNQPKGSNFTTIDFNYPSLNRKDLLDVKSINNKSSNFKKLDTNRDWTLNLYNLDIEGSCPRKFAYFLNKDEFINKNNDIEKSSTKDYYKYINKISFNLTNDDIELSKPQCNKNPSSRHTNPLSPKYIFSKPTLLPIPAPKFIRDSISVKDIKGTSPNKLGYNKKLFKDPRKKENIIDINKKIPYTRKTKYEYMNYDDVTKKRMMYRNTNPLRPQYNWSYIEDKKILGPIDGNSPLARNKYLYKNPYNLNTKDIEGTNPGTIYPIYKFKGNTYYLKTKDIYGAQGDTLIRGIITKRNLNPLKPMYQYLGHSEIQNIDNNPYYMDFNETKKEEIETKLQNKNENNKNTIVINKIKLEDENSKTINEYRALNRKLNINKFYGQLNKNISEKNLEIKNEFKNKYFDENKNSKNYDKLKNQLKPINKRKIKHIKNASTYAKENSKDIFGIKNYKFMNSKTDEYN